MDGESTWRVEELLGRINLDTNDLAQFKLAPVPQPISLVHLQTSLVHTFRTKVQEMGGIRQYDFSGCHLSEPYTIKAL